MGLVNQQMEFVFIAVNPCYWLHPWPSFPGRVHAPKSSNKTLTYPPVTAILNNRFMSTHFNPQPKQTRKARRANGVKESEVQAAVNNLLDVLGVPYFRVPDAVYRTFKTGMLPCPGQRGAVLAELRGWADNILFEPLYQRAGVKLCLAAFVENKSATGEMHGEQKAMGRQLGYNIVRDVSEVQLIVNVLRRVAGELRGEFQ